ncbi:MAG: FkbM family methyltransferase [Rhodospirillaceae bacterium]|nr:FkbM family methyltransferase [Rhodospirillaceae bacterium]
MNSATQASDSKMGDFKPQYSFEEWVKYTLVPPKLYMWRLLRKHARRGERELKLLPQLVDKNKIALDIGANKGVYTHTLAKLATHVHSFEPHPKMFPLLARALPENATAYHVAVSDTGGTAELVIPSYNKRGLSNQGASLDPSKKNAPFGFTSVAIASRTIDSYNFTNVGFIKVDVEGFEQAVVRGLLETAAREKPWLMIEIEEWHTKRPIEDCLADMRVLNADVFFAKATESGAELRPIADFDPENDHRKRRKQPGYVGNFFFKPR